MRTERQILYDVAAVSVAVAVGAVTLWGSPTPVVRQHHGATAVVLLALAVSLWWRRRAPLATVWLTVTATGLATAVEVAVPGTILRTGADLNAVPWLPPTAPFAAYAALAFANRARAAVPPVAVLIGLSAVPWAQSGALGSRNLAFTASAALLGTYVATAERERHMIAERALAEQRSRLATEMHDVVSHRVSLIVLQAGALEVTATDEATRKAAEEVRANGWQALAELREVVRLLHAPSHGEEGGVVERPDARVPAPDLAELVAASESVGVRVDLVQDGQPIHTSPVIGRTAYRIVQEALTNVRKHAHGAQARVHVRYRPDGLRLTIDNTASPNPGDPGLSDAGGGHGLEGLRRRITLVGGTIHTGPRPDGGFRVDAALPASPERPR
ncbi:sensor histidine kinase [Asanoa iriomotensis]|uniref:sensor histidine kinase n=1 Tax=Asanoa iriomotensis TaxID=234613 RepID=UPI001945A8BB|nr:histidine kinase [Asanoa iriomotensis]